MLAKWSVAGEILEREQSPFVVILYATAAGESEEGGIPFSSPSPHIFYIHLFHPFSSVPHLSPYPFSSPRLLPSHSSFPPFQRKGEIFAR